MQQVPELVPNTISANIPTPPIGFVNQFYDSSDGNALKVKNSSGVVTGVFSGSTPIQIGPVSE